MMTKNPKRVVLIAGPTASGKSALAMEMASAENGIIINADSMQVYSELRVVTARPSIADEAFLPHRLYGHVSGAEPYSVAQWQREAMLEVKHAHAVGKLPIIVGGTGLYFYSLINGLAEIPEIKPEVRAKWRTFAGDLHAELQKRDVSSSNRLHKSDRQRLVRALEVVESTGKTIGNWQAAGQTDSPLKAFDVQKIFKNLNREVLYAKANLRFEQMLEQGALQEVADLACLPAGALLTKAIGVRELQAFHQKEITIKEAKSYAQTATRQYIKRQLTWWRGKMADWEEVTPQALK